MKVTVYEFIQGERLPHLVPLAYREEVARRTRPNWIYSLLLFAHDRRDVVPSAPVRRGLRRLKRTATNGVVMVGTVFTEEALALAAEMKATVVSLHRAFWTDESARMRQH